MAEIETHASERLRDISIVVPVYQGEHTLVALAEEVARLTEGQRSPKGRSFRIAELLLVNDGAMDGSAAVMMGLSESYAFVRPIWLSRNFGQHAATLAGMASALGDWVVTLDEDGQQNPADIGAMLDHALDGSARLVYAKPINPPPHGFLRNFFSKLAKWVFVRLLGARLGAFNSFRLIEGEIARGVAAYAGANVYLDIALSWVVSHSQHCPVELRQERGRRSGYTPRKLLRHFWHLVLSSGTRPLRIVAMLGFLALLFAIAFSAFVIWKWYNQSIPVQGWTSMIIVVCWFAGLTLVSLGVMAEYLGFAVGMAMGRPAYLIVSRPGQQLDRGR
jgi:undecaprenyl-phosphate 4-deoxy-4-formamido-L-arabinose transferase